MSAWTGDGAAGGAAVVSLSSEEEAVEPEELSSLEPADGALYVGIVGGGVLRERLLRSSAQLEDLI